jgi:hypothetical protein
VIGTVGASLLRWSRSKGREVASAAQMTFERHHNFPASERKCVQNAGRFVCRRHLRLRAELFERASSFSRFRKSFKGEGKAASMPRLPLPLWLILQPMRWGSLLIWHPRWSSRLRYLLRVETPTRAPMKALRSKRTAFFSLMKENWCFW